MFISCSFLSLKYNDPIIVKELKMKHCVGLTDKQ